MNNGLKNGRLIEAGKPCPFSDKCRYAADKSCNRPNAMENDFSCGTARAFALVGSGRMGNAQFHVTEGTFEASRDDGRGTTGESSFLSALRIFLDEAPVVKKKKRGRGRPQTPRPE